ncbi:PREDICTED: nose resistant to fluoxetine protein 6 [Drosophila arizonae]|uniref:Nose resistant to fluoxetine protein 6 n=1 Tax=Drosophila arizonae TaxID=7263 RepID=A0ABM1PQG0_DROAR|nr:PREDICTED: nose resistant to fluoxetine protein 6 [Drosophila arizonae]
MALEKVRLIGSGLPLGAVQGLLIVCLALALGQQEAAGAYSQQELLTWLQQSNLGYQVLQQANSSSDELLCATEVGLLLQAAERHALPALQVLDAWGKFPHGLLYGHFSDLGNYESCLSQSLSNSATALAASKYCLAHIAFESLLAMDEDTVSISIGTCIPAACSANQLNRWLNNYLQRIFEDSVAPQLQLVQESNCALAAREPMAALDWFAIVLLITLALLVMLCTLLDYFKGPQKLLAAFSLRQNLRQLMKISRPSIHLIPCLHGIRCLTIIWIIWGHDYMFLLLAPNVNSYEVIAWAQTPFSMILQSGTIAVDTFFLLSGMLLVMSTLRELERRSGRLNVPLMYLHRIVRLTPVLAIAVLFLMTLFPRLDSGPLWQQFTSSSQLCYDTWWATLLYVQNYAAAGRMCLGHAWYLAVDMQLFLLSPLLLWPLYRWRRRAVAGIVLLIALLFGCVFSIIMLNKLTVFNRKGNLGADSMEMRMIYYTTHARAMPWLIGLLFGCFLHGEQGRRRRLPAWLMLLLWLLALLFIATAIWSVYPYTRPGAAEISPLAGAFYLCCSRIAWPLAICWLIWACQSGRGGLVNTLLSWSFWQPVSKLSYCLYIWHLLIEMANTGRIKSSQHFSNYDAILHFWSDFGITLLVALLMYLCVEAPFVQVELHLIRTLRSRATPTAPKPHTVTPTVSLAVIAAPTSISQQNLIEA